MSSVACGGDDSPLLADGEPDAERPPVLTFDPDMLDLDAGAPPHFEAGPGDPDARVEDASSGDGGDREPSVFAATEATNTPHAQMKYGGPQTGPNLTLLGSHLELTSGSSGLSIEWLGRMRNDFADTICAFALDMRFLGQGGSPLFELSATADLQPYMNGASTVDCAGPGEVFYLRALGTEAVAAALTLADVYTIEWNYRLAGYLDDFAPSARTMLDDLSVSQSLLGYGLTGSVKNTSAATLSFPSVVAYLVNAGGQPLARLGASRTTAIPGSGSWVFTTGTHKTAFPLTSVDVVIGYSIN